MACPNGRRYWDRDDVEYSTSVPSFQRGLTDDPHDGLVAEILRSLFENARITNDNPVSFEIGLGEGQTEIRSNAGRLAHSDCYAGTHVRRRSS